MNPTFKVAFATTDRKRVNQHFGSARTFIIYSVSQEQTELVEIAEFGDLSQDGHEAKLATKLDLLKGCAAVYCQAVGGSAIRQLIAHGIQPIRVDENSSIEQLLRDFKTELDANSSSWVAKACKRHESSDLKRFDAMEAEGWQE
jgi:nitrogen fixation protein NifX